MWCFKYKNTSSPCQKPLSVQQAAWGEEVVARKPEVVARLCSDQQRHSGPVLEWKAGEAANWFQASLAADGSSGASAEATVQ